MDSDPLLGAVLADRYRVLAPIGRGGAGTVYRGVQLQLDREVAIKVVRHDVSERVRGELEARFFREASLAGRLSHPAIVHTIDYGATEHGLQYVVMELLVGRTLKAALKGGPLDPDEAARIASELARGLHHAHSRGLVHRDVKASNVLLVRDDEGVEHPKLLDFGLVKSVSRELDVTQTPTYLGTPLYMSPEQAKGSQDLDGRSDQYSLGCLLYKMVSGELPFEAESPMATALKHNTEPYPLMAERAPNVQVDPDLEAIVRRCMAKSPDDRFPDAAALARALDQWRGGVGASLDLDDESADRVPAPRRRGRLAVVGALGLVGLMVVGSGLVLVAMLVVLFGFFAIRSAPSGVDPLAQGAAEPSSTGATAQESPGPVAGSDTDTDTDAYAEASLDEDALDAPDAKVPPLPSDTADSAVARPPAPESVVAASSTAPTAPGPPDADDLPSAPAASRPAPTRSAGDSTEASARAEPSTGAPPPDELERPVVVDEVSFTRRSQMSATLALANGATREELIDAGVNARFGMVDAVIDGRPYRSVQQLGGTAKVGPDTMRKLFRAANGQP